MRMITLDNLGKTEKWTTMMMDYEVNRYSGTTLQALQERVDMELAPTNAKYYISMLL